MPNSSGAPTQFRERMQEHIAAVVQNSVGLLKGGEKVQQLLGDKLRYDEDFAKQQAKLARNYGFDEFLVHCSTFAALNRAKDMFLSHSGRLAAHSQALQASVAQPLRHRLGDLRASNKRLTEETRRLERERDSLREALRKARAKYWRAAAEVEELQQAMDRACSQESAGGSGPAAKPDKSGMQRLSQKANQAARECKAHETAYQEAAARMQEFNTRYHMQVDALLTGFERNDLQLVDALKQSLTGSLRVMEDLLRELQDDIAAAREVVEGIEGEADIRLFVDHTNLVQPQSPTRAAASGNEDAFEEYPWKYQQATPPARPNVPTTAPAPVEPQEVIPPEIYGRVMAYVQQLSFVGGPGPRDDASAIPSTPSWVVLDRSVSLGDGSVPPQEAAPAPSPAEAAAAAAAGDVRVGAEEMLELVRGHEARMALGRILTRQRVNCVTLTQESWEELGRVIRHALGLCQDAAGEVTDVKAGSILLNMCQTFCYSKGDGTTRVYLQQLVKDHALFTNLRFWEESLFDALQTEKAKQQPVGGVKWKDLEQDEQEELENRDQNITFGQLSTFVFNMLSMGLPVELVNRFVEKACMVNSLCEEFRFMLQATLERTVADMQAQAEDAAQAQALPASPQQADAEATAPPAAPLTDATAEGGEPAPAHTPAPTATEAVAEPAEAPSVPLAAEQAPSAPAAAADSGAEPSAAAAATENGTD